MCHQQELEACKPPRLLKKDLKQVLKKWEIPGVCMPFATKSSDKEL
jgi:hypothetical protein